MDAGEDGPDAPAAKQGKHLWSGCIVKRTPRPGVRSARPRAPARAARAAALHFWHFFLEAFDA